MVERLCHLKKTHPEQEYGFNLHGEKGKKGQYIGSVDDGSPADLAGLKAGDKIVSVNDRPIAQDDHKQVVSKIREDPMSCKLLVLVGDDSGGRKVSTKSATPTPSPTAKTNPPIETIKLQQMTNGDILSVKPPENEKEQQSLKPKLCVLNKILATDEYGFNLHAENGRTYYIGKVDKNSIAEIAGLVEGQRIVGVNKTIIDSTTVHKDVVNLIKATPSSVSILVASAEVDDYYKENSLPFSFDDTVDASGKIRSTEVNIQQHTKQSNQNGYVNIPTNGASAIEKKNVENVTATIPDRMTHIVNQLHLREDYVNDKDVGGKPVVANGQAPRVSVVEDEQTKRKHHVSSSSSQSSFSVENSTDKDQQPYNNNNNNKITQMNGPNNKNKNGDLLPQPVHKKSNGSSGSGGSQNDEFLKNMTVSDLRERLKRKKDPRTEQQNLSMQEKYEIVNRL